MGESLQQNSPGLIGLDMYCTMDSAYMGDSMCQIGRDVWKFNFIGTCQNDRETSEESWDVRNKIFFQHQMKNLVFALWANNNIVKTLSNFHSPELLEAGSGVLQRQRVECVCEKEQTVVECPRCVANSLQFAKCKQWSNA
jgi:hypothetical protein